MKLASVMGRQINWLLDKFSITKVKALAKCPRYAYHKYVEGLKFPANFPIVRGNAVHSGQEADNRAKLAGEKLSLTAIHEVAMESLRTQAPLATGVPPGAVDDFASAHAEQLSKFEKIGARARIVPVPNTVEAAFQVELVVAGKPALVEGFVDVVSQDPETGLKAVVDYKAVKRAVSDKEALNHHQLTLEGYGSEAATAYAVSFVDGNRQNPTVKVSAAQQITTERVQRLMRFLGDQILAFREAYEKDFWPKCSPDNFYCARGVCEFYDRCYPSPDPELSKFVEIIKIAPSGSLPPQEWRKKK